MFSSAELIEALQRRLRKGRSIRPSRPPGEFPSGWTAWFASMHERAGKVTGAAADAFVSIFLAREPVYPQGYVQLNRWQAFTRLWRHDWRESGRDDRKRRIASMVLSILFHILWMQALFWLMYARFISGAEEEPRRGENVVQVEFIGEGTPVEEGGGVAQDPQPVEELASSPAPAAAAPAASAPAPAAAMPEPSVAQEQPPVPEVPAPVVEQPLQVTETPEPDSTFVLSPPRIEDLPSRPLATPELRAPTTEVRTLEVPVTTPPPQIRPLQPRDINVPDLRQREVDVVQREVVGPAPELSTRRLPTPTTTTPDLARDGPQVVTRDVPLRATGTAPAGAAERDAATAADGRAAASTGQAPSPAATSGGTRPGQGASMAVGTTGAGPRPGQPPGALPSARRGDDWGDSTRNVPGGQAGSSSGLFNADGTPRLAGGGRAGGGLPPGTITEDYEKIDRMGTWLKRPPVGYEPTAFDRFWVPHENLLEEWVRRSIKEVLIPIPGTSKRIKCAVAMLMLGGACGITDPNMLDNEANARKPPDVPFKRELQEDQDALRQPATQP